MKTLTYEDYLADPLAVLGRIQLQAQHARALAIHRYIVAPAARACGRLLAIRGIRLRLDPLAGAMKDAAKLAA